MKIKTQWSKFGGQSGEKNSSKWEFTATQAYHKKKIQRALCLKGLQKGEQSPKLVGGRKYSSEQE